MPGGFILKFRHKNITFSQNMRTKMLLLNTIFPDLRLETN